MSNWDHILLVIVLLVTQTSALHLTRELQFATQNPYTVSICSNIYTVSKDETHIRVLSSDKNYKPCSIALDPRTDNIFGRNKAVPLGTKKIIVYGISHANDLHTVKLVYHTVLIIDLFSCSKLVVAVGPDRVPSHFPATAAQIVTHSTSKFDVFFLGPQVCAPCRFDAKGNAINLKQQLKSELSLITNFYVQPLERSGGNAYAVINGNGATTLKVLDPNFKITNNQSLKNTIFDLSTASSAKTSYIGVIYNSADSPYKFSYSLYDSTLRRLFEKPLPSLGSEYLGLGAQFKIDSRGNSYISLLQLSFEEGDTKVSLTAYDVKGNKIGGSNELAMISSGGYEIQALLIQDREYCLVIHKQGEPLGITDIKCLDITKNI